MKTFYKYTTFAIIVCLIFATVSCSNKTKGTLQPEITPSSVVSPSLSEQLTPAEINNHWDISSAHEILLDGYSDMINITKPGDYVLRGTSENCSIVVNCVSDGLVRLILNEVNITSKTSSCINIVQAEKTIILLAEGTQNTLTDAQNYTALDENQEPDACIFSKDDIVINGSGTLTVNGNYNNGIHGKDDLYILDGVINVFSVDDGITGKDLLMIDGGTFNIVSEGDAFKATNENDDGKGILSITSGTFNITTGGGSKNASSNAGNGGFWGDWSNTSSSKSAKGLKAAQGILIEDGHFTIDSADDSIHSNVSVEIKGGEFNITSGDDGIHADNTLTIKNGTIEINKSYEGLESSIMHISDGSINIISSDDGINIAGGNDQSAMGGRPGQNPFATTDSASVYLKIDSGEINIDASGDGLDSNGSIYINGGCVYISGPENSGNGALDYAVSCQVSGGILVAAGEAGMAQAPSHGQNTIVVSGFTGTDLVVSDKSGNVVLSHTLKKTLSHVVISHPDFTEGQTFTVYSGNEEIGSCQINSTLNYIGSATEGNNGMGGMHADGFGGPGAPGGPDRKPGGFGR